MLKFKLILIEKFTDYNRFLSTINWDLEIDCAKNASVIENNTINAIIGSV